MAVRGAAPAPDRRDSLARALAETEIQVAALRAELDDDPGATGRLVAAARERAAAERAERVRRALDQLAELKRWTRAPERPARTSTTDREARVMKLADGGCRPAYNGRFATDTASQIIVGVVPTNGHERDQLGPMVDQLGARYGRAPAEYRVDGGYVNHAEIERLSGGGMTI